MGEADSDRRFEGAMEGYWKADDLFIGPWQMG